MDYYAPFGALYMNQNMSDGSNTQMIGYLPFDGGSSLFPASQTNGKASTTAMIYDRRSATSSPWLDWVFVNTADVYVFEWNPSLNEASRNTTKEPAFANYLPQASYGPGTTSSIYTGTEFGIIFQNAVVNDTTGAISKGICSITKKSPSTGVYDMGERIASQAWYPEQLTADPAFGLTSIRRSSATHCARITINLHQAWNPPNLPYSEFSPSFDTSTSVYDRIMRHNYWDPSNSTLLVDLGLAGSGNVTQMAWLNFKLSSLPPVPPPTQPVTILPTPLSTPHTVCKCSGSPPSSQFACNETTGVYYSTGSVSSPTTLVISAPTVINGSLTIGTGLVLEGLSSTIAVSECLSFNDTIVITVVITTGDYEKLKTGSKTYNLLTFNGKCVNASNAAVNIDVKSEGVSKCHKMSANAQTTDSTLSAVFTLNSGSCNNWWIVLVSVVCGVLFLAVVLILIFTLYKPARKIVRPFSQRRQASTAAL